MIRHTRFNRTAPGALNGFKRRPLYRALALWGAAVTCGSASLAGNVAVAAPQVTDNLPAPNQPAVNATSTGTPGPYGSGQQGGNGSDGNYELGSGNIVPSILFSSVGGAGGTGQDGGDPTGNGGAGGNAGALVLTLDAGSGVNSILIGPAAVWLSSTGGNGGTAGKMATSSGYPGQPGAGGNSQSINFNQYASVISTNGWNGSTPGTTAILLTANGGNAAQPLGSDGADGSGSVTGANGNRGGFGGDISYALYQGDVLSKGSAIVVSSQGGNGGDGTIAYSDIGKGKGGDGGQGGEAGQMLLVIGQGGSSAPNIVATGAPAAAAGASVPIDTNGDVVQAAVMAAGIQAQSLGGLGGLGGEGDGTAGSGGAGGAAGAGNAVNIALNNANISATGFAAAGVLAQSIGGAGGNGGGAGGMFFSGAGNGSPGGASGAVTITMGNASNSSWPSDLISTTGADSMGVVAQSIGGGGGAGGSVQAGSLLAGVTIGGNGESGGAAGPVTLNNGALASTNNPVEAGFIVATQGERSSGLVAQSIGGGGGTGGSASNTVLGPFSLTIGGSGGDGGSAGTPGTTQVSVLNQGIVSTAGNHAKGVVAQAVGGGGGDGGSAQSLSVSSQLNVSVAVGGNGGKGGSSGDVAATNNGEILTSGSDAWGLLAQSVAGGGGNGGSSVSDAFQLPSAPDAPTLVVNASVGGSGGDGSAAGNVYAYNNGVIMTAGATAHGLMAQSVGGGGGNGGDSSAFTVAVGNGTKADVSIAVGGKAGDGGTGGNVTVDNGSNALIWTLGDSADGIFAQSVGGGGGSGGVSKNTDEFLNTDLLNNNKPASGSLTVNLGGNGGAGTAGGNVTVTNEGNILTMGDSSNGIFAQSIGGGGGVATGGTANSAVGDVTETITTSGSGNGSGTGGAVSATNNATVVTYGGDAAGMLVQSVGGGGGKVGTGSTAGLPVANVSLSDYLASSGALKNVVANYGGVNAFGPAGWTLTSLQQMESWAQDYLAYAAAHPADTAPDGSGGTVSLQTFLGSSANGPNPGAYSNAGDGGIVSATNNFTLQTFGPASPGIVAQSIGAGGVKTVQPW